MYCTRTTSTFTFYIYYFTFYISKSVNYFYSKFKHTKYPHILITSAHQHISTSTRFNYEV